MTGMVVVVAHSPEQCADVASRNGWSEYIPVWNFASCVRMTGFERGIYADSSIDQIPLADRILMNQYMKYLNNNKYNGFGYRDLHPNLADPFILELTEWVDDDSA